MFGHSMGSLKVSVKDVGGNGSEKIVWSMAGNQGSEWKEAVIPIITNVDAKVKMPSCQVNSNAQPLTG